MEVFILYTLCILFYSFFVSSEESLRPSSEPAGIISQLEGCLLRYSGGLIPYLLSGLSEWKILSVIGAGAEMAAYLFVKDGVIAYAKGVSRINPSGHSFMLLNGIFVLWPVVAGEWEGRKGPLGVVAGMVLIEYTRQIAITAKYHHTLTEVWLGVLGLFLFRGLVVPVRRVYGNAYKNEWGVRGWMISAAGIGIVGIISINWSR